MMTEQFKDVPPFNPRSPLAVSEGMFGEAVRMVVQQTGFDDEKAMRVVEAVFGPLKLLSPPDWDNAGSECPVAYFPYEGGWRFCQKEHGFDGEVPEFHYTDSADEEDAEQQDPGRTQWNELLDVGRIFLMKEPERGPGE